MREVRVHTAVSHSLTPGVVDLQISILHIIFEVHALYVPSSDYSYKGYMYGLYFGNGRLKAYASLLQSLKSMHTCLSGHTRYSFFMYMYIHVVVLL